MKPLWTAVAFVGLLMACSGGTGPVTVSDPGPGSDESPAPSPGKGSTPPVDNSSGAAAAAASSGGQTSSSSSTGGGMCLTCSQILAGITDSPPCPNSSTLYQGVFSCACANCSTECEASCKSGDPPAGACQACTSGACESQLTQCENDGGGA